MAHWLLILFHLPCVPVAVVETGPGVPSEYALSQNYPKPFDRSPVSSSVPEESSVPLRVYSTLGQKVATLVNGAEFAGPGVVDCDGTDDYGQKVTSGVYFYVLEVAPSNGGSTFTAAKKMILLESGVECEMGPHHLARCFPKLRERSAPSFRGALPMYTGTLAACQGDAVIHVPPLKRVCAIFVREDTNAMPM